MTSVFFKNLIGHRQLKKRFTELITAGRMPHASIFAGAAGLGKTVAAGAVAAALVGRPVLKHIDFSTAESMIHDGEDVFYIGPEKTMLKTGQFRDLQDIISLRGSSGKRRVFIIDHVETMNAEFANRMLKTLEEPAEGIYFILVTNRPTLLLPTIISRCVVFHFEPVPDEELIMSLKERYGYTGADYEQIAAISDGNVRTALNFLQDGNSVALDKAFFFVKTVTESEAPYAEWITYSADFKDDESVDIMKWIAMILRDLLILRTHTSRERLRLKQFTSRLRTFAPQWSEDAIMKGLQAIEEGMEGTARHVNIHLIWDYLCISFLQGRGDY